MPPHELYQSLNRGVVQGAITQWTAVGVFNLYEVTTHHVDATLGSSNAMVFMNKKSFEKLSDKGKKILMAHSGEKLSRDFGAFLDTLNAEIREKTRALKTHTLITLSPSQAKLWQDKVQPINQQWADNTPNGADVLAAYRQEVKNIRAGK